MKESRFGYVIMYMPNLRFYLDEHSGTEYLMEATMFGSESYANQTAEDLNEDESGWRVLKIRVDRTTIIPINDESLIA